MEPSNKLCLFAKENDLINLGEDANHCKSTDNQNLLKINLFLTKNYLRNIKYVYILVLFG
ncbi:hypothetical protein BH09BAC1_BH09BAC1_22260 [soil metagenome]